MMTRALITIAIGSLLCAPVSGQATQPASNGRLDYRASQAFERGDYAAALPLLRKLEVELAGKPAKQSVIRDRIFVCETALGVSASDAIPGNTTRPAATSAPAVAAPVVEQRKPHALPAPGTVLSMEIKELGNFEYDQDKGGNIPDDVKKLDGSKIRLKGYMIPVDQAERITQFALVPSLFSCCYGQPPQIQHTVVVTVPKGQTVNFDFDQVVVEGKLKVSEQRDDGYITSIFQVDSTSVTPAPKDAKR